MDYIEQEILLHTEGYFGGAVPLSLSSRLLQRLEATTKPCVRMALEGTSASVWATPAWLERCVDVRTLGFSERAGVTVLHLSAPRLGDAAPKLFEQNTLFPGVASPEDTALQVFGKIAREVRLENTASDLYDNSLLKKFSQWKPLLQSSLKSIDLPDSHGSTFDSSVAVFSAVLYRKLSVLKRKCGLICDFR